MTIDLLPLSAPASVPMDWLLTAIWGVSIILAGALGQSINKKIADMSEATDRIANTVQALAEGHARIEERLASNERLQSLERANHESRCEMMERRLARLEHRNDDAA